MVSSHSSCVVKSYLQWLQDSDYSPQCGFCSGPLASEDCVRLVCYCLYHWACLDTYCRSLPASTAPAGYTCPACSQAIFPPDNLVSPVADKLRQTLQDVNWARAGLGLPLLSDNLERKPCVVPAGPRPTPEGEDISSDPLNLAHELVAKKAAREPTSSPWKPESTVVNFDTPTVRRGVGDVGSLATSPLITGDPDSEGNKYKRRAPTDWFLRWWKTMMKPAAQRRRSLYHWIMIAVLVVLGFATMIMIFSYFGRNGADDPFLDPMNNPNIRIADMM